MASAILILLSGIIVAFTTSLLVQSGLKANIYSYSELAQQVLGSKMKVLIEIFISLAQFSFTVYQISFII